MAEQIERSHTDPEALMQERDAAAFLGFSRRALEAWRSRGGGPPFVRVSARAVRYRRRDLIAWAESRLCSSTSDPSPGGDCAAA
jgi:predicted DNA-binding transcriptional regulator AlpA